MTEENKGILEEIVAGLSDYSKVNANRKDPHDSIGNSLDSSTGKSSAFNLGYNAENYLSAKGSPLKATEICDADIGELLPLQSFCDGAHAAATDNSLNKGVAKK